METERIYNELIKKVESNKIFKNEPMKKHTSFRIGGNADIYIKPDNVDDIKYIVEFVKENNIPLQIIGNGSNMLVKDNGIRGIVLKPDIKEVKLIEKEDKINIIVGSGVPLPKLAIEMGKKGYTGLEFAAGIPGTVGGAVRMNAGAYGSEMKNIVVSSTYMDLDGNIKTIDNNEHEFDYRKSIYTNQKYIILSTNIELNKGNIIEIEKKMYENMKSRKEKQPLDLPSAGSTFKRQEGVITAALIDKAGLKGFSIGDASVSTKHAGFIVNKGNATAEDVLNLVKHIQNVLYEKFNVNVELEIEVVGE